VAFLPRVDFPDLDARDEAMLYLFTHALDASLKKAKLAGSLAMDDKSLGLLLKLCGNVPTITTSVFVREKLMPAALAAREKLSLLDDDVQHM
jgi:hypothetical protein